MGAWEHEMEHKQNIKQAEHTYINLRATTWKREEDESRHATKLIVLISEV